jgi:hypothetical protein
MPTPIECDIAFNQFRDHAEEFVAAFHDPDPADRYALLTRRIVALLTEGHGLPIEDPDHPIQKFGHRVEDTLLRLHQQLDSEFQGSSIRSLLLAFFHSTGFYREELTDLLDAFETYACTCLNLP